MLVIENVRTEIRNPNRAFLLADIRDDVYHWNREMWYSVPVEYGQYLSDDSADCFVLALLTIAVESGQDITVNAPVSRRLAFNLKNTIIPLYSKFYNKSRFVRLEASGVVPDALPAAGVATGCSLGVDSLSAIFGSMDESTESGYKLSHLAFFNCGQMGDDDPEGVAAFMQSELAVVRSFAEKVRMPVVDVDSNMNDFFRESNVEIRVSVASRSAGCAMAVQRLFGKYLYASSYPAADVIFERSDFAHMDAAVIPLLSTERTEFISGDAMLTRVDKTKRVMAYPLTKEYLTVCWAEQVAFLKQRNTQFLKHKTKFNCGWCEKCKRTLLTIELLGGTLAEYAGVFEISEYKKRKAGFVGYVVANCNQEPFYRQIYQLMSEDFLRKYKLSILKWHVLVWLNRTAIGAVIVKLANAVRNTLRA